MGRLLILGFLILAGPLHAEDLFFSQAGAGTHDGSSLANAWSLAEANTGANWGVGAGKVSAGDTLIGNGTITGQLVIQGSGTDGSPITIRLATGAKFSAARWSTAGEGVFSTAGTAIYGNNKNFITIDGNSNSPGIEATDTGTPGTFTHQDYNIGVLAYQGSLNWIVKNLLVTNMYRRTPGSATDENQDGGAIQFRGGVFKNIVITNCNVAQNNVGIYFGFNGACSNILVIDTVGTAAGEGSVVHGAENGSSSLDGFIVDRCDFSDEFTWSGVAVTHCNHMHLHSTPDGSSVTNEIVRNTKFHGTGSSFMTSFLFLEGYIYNSKIYNCLFVPSDTTFTGNGHITLKGATNTFVANNTWVGQGVGIAFGTTSFGGAMDGGHVFTNNLIQNYATMVNDDAGSLDAANYNIYSPDSGSAFTGFRTFAQWKTFCGCDAQSKVAVVDLDVNYIPVPGDTEARLFGRNLTPQGITSDFNGVARPAPPTLWTAGAFQNQTAITWNVNVLNAAVINVGQ